MTDHRLFPNRRTIRLKGYDYSQAGIYFITICTYKREHLFGKIQDGKMILNECGQIAWNEWMKTPQLRPHIELDAFVVMPNHIHGIIIINSSNACKGGLHPPDENGQSDMDNGRMQSAPTGTSQTVGAIVRGYKSAVTRQINLLHNASGISVWHRNYYEHIIRNNSAYENIAEYIRNNPSRWNDDCFFDQP